MKTRYHGSCHCKAVRFEADIDLSQGTSKCNCTFCWKNRYWSTIITPDAFTLVAGAEVLHDGEQGGFCTICGVRPYRRALTEGWGEALGFPPEIVSVNLAALDDLAPEVLLAAPLKHCDGLHDNWWQPPAEVRHL